MANRHKFRGVKRELQRIEERLSNRQEKINRGPAVVISFCFYSSDGCVRNMMDRPLREWELYKNAGTGVATIDCEYEYALRQKLTEAKGVMNIVADEPCFVRKAIPEAPASQRVPFECFMAWIFEQERKPDENEQNRTQNGQTDAETI